MASVLPPPVRTVVLDYGETLTFGPRTDPRRPVDPYAAAALHVLHRAGKRLILASNTRPDQDRHAALRRGGVDHLFHEVFLSAELGVAKPHAEFYRRVLAAAGCEPPEVLWVGDSVQKDVIGPSRHGMRPALVGRAELPDGVVVPGEVMLIRHVRDLPALLTGGLPATSAPEGLDALGVRPSARVSGRPVSRG
ncbi:HAD family hydrolase [Spongiactinospora sp. TRM90649]|uniref:HAD family hydrolase n=1 Tax=Spongiactinospora sp. TRM90649 TaxID=3031114 RepID=UPI0023F90C9C|nr:HAD family hydrolase [Spongiactinospora sp. TRM90649]MDF5751104.1 HAD family hydrolase [Spongiactinospora sp. TRM90649]